MTRSRSRPRALRLAVLPTVVALAAGACGYHKDSTVVRLQDPGKCVPVDVAASPATARLLDDTADRFNGSPAAKLRDGTCAFVRVETVESTIALRELQAGWPDTDRIGPAPIVWVPESTMWGELLDARLTQAHRPRLAPNGTPFARTPLVIAMPAPMAKALGAPRRALGWTDLRQLAANPRGWGAYGHREWGRFRLGKGNPNWSATGLDQTVALDAVPSVDPRTLEQSVIYYGDTSTYFDNWKRLAEQAPARALVYCSAVITDERSVVAYDTGNDLDATALDRKASRPKLPLVAVYPRDAAIESDNPMIVLNAPWSSATARAGARRFMHFALQPEAQTEVAAAGFRPVRAGARSTVLTSANGVDPAAGTSSVAPASPNEIVRALAHWETTRHLGRVLVLFDLSDSMGDPADPLDPGGPTKIAVAKSAVTDALGELAPDDEIGLRVFSTGLRGARNPNWRDVVPIRRLSTNRRRLVDAIAALQPLRGSPLYRATSGAYDTIARGVDTSRIDSVVLITDGYNEDDHDTDLGALLDHLASRSDVHVFTITYSNDADATTLTKIAQATNAANFDARDTLDLPEMAQRALASQ
jgi:Ca-activated chloride channel family protein